MASVCKKSYYTADNNSEDKDINIDNPKDKDISMDNPKDKNISINDPKDKDISADNLNIDNSMGENNLGQDSNTN